MATKKDSDDLIIGKKDIEKFMNRDLSCQFQWINAFGYPIVKRGGYPTISLKEFRAWAKEWEVDGIPPATITTEMLEKVARKKRIALMENTPLNSIDEICEAVHREGHFVIDWIKRFDDCPVKKVDGKYQARKRDLIQFLENNGIPWGAYGIESTR